MQTIRIEGQEVTVVGETSVDTSELVEGIKKEVGKVVLAHIDVGNFRSASTTTLTAAILTLLREQGIELVEDREEKQRQLAVKVDEHLPQKLREVSKPICELAHEMNELLPDGPEKSAGLRKLLEAKDCLVRAYISN